MTRKYSPPRLIILPCLMMLFTLPAFAQLANCSGSFLENSGGLGVKVKKFCEGYDLDWSLDKNEAAFTGGNFCLIAYKGSDTATKCGDDDDERIMYDASINITGADPDDTSNGKFMLGGKIPVTIKLEGQPDDFYPGQTIDLPYTDGKCVCADTENQYNLIITVSKDKILKSGITTNSAVGNFRLNGFHELGSLNGSVGFQITLTLATGIQISGLEDMQLVENNGSASASQNFCVFALGTERFSLRANSEEGNGESFKLINSNDETLSYSMKVEDSNSKVENYAGNKNPIRGWKPSNQYLCSDHRAENMTLTVNVANTDSVSAGVYSDTMTLTVRPN
ncbi:hypothetical protein [Endozoicomonas sp.]|uniref:hypothetical protein n=1 Tax=Endozoicomonas sp. TaxID=1892382 RepID=UPI00383BBBEB